MQARGLRSAIPRRNAHHDIFECSFRVFHEHIEVAILCEPSGINQLELRLVARALCVFFAQLVVRECGVGIFVEELQIRTGRRLEQIVVILFDVLAVIAFLVGQSEKPFFQDAIFFIPQRQAQANVLMAIAKSRDAVFSPAIRAGARMIVRKIIPGVAVRAVILAHRAPLPLRQIRAPSFPVRHALGAGPQPLLFGCQRGFHAHPLSAMFGTVMIPGFVPGRRAPESSGGAQSRRTLLVAPAYWQAGRMHAYSGTQQCAPRIAIAWAPVAQLARDPPFSFSSRAYPAVACGNSQWDENNSLERNHRTVIAAWFARRRSFAARGSAACRRCRDGRDRAHVFSGQCVRPRFSISPGFLAGCRGAMAPGHFLPPLGGMGQLGLRRAAFYFLSAGLLDARSNSRFSAPVENGAGRLYLAGAVAGRIFDVAIHARMALAARSECRRDSLRSESVSLDHRVLPRRLRRAASERLAPAGILGRRASAARRLARPAISGRSVCADLAGERTRRGAGRLLVDATVFRRVHFASRQQAVASPRGVGGG